jgi:hypothetical protein
VAILRENRAHGSIFQDKVITRKLSKSQTVVQLGLANCDVLDVDIAGLRARSGEIRGHNRERRLRMTALIALNIKLRVDKSGFGPRTEPLRWLSHRGGNEHQTGVRLRKRYQ